jgi:hypothetical protein
MSRWFKRLVVAGVATASLVGVGVAGAAAAQAAPPSAASAPSSAKSSAALAGAPYIYGYYTNYPSCDAAGFAGVYYHYWYAYSCDSRYLPGYLALVVWPY